MIYTASGTASETFIAQTPERCCSLQNIWKVEEPLLTFSEVGVASTSLLSQEPLSNVRLMIMLVLELQRLLAMQKPDLLVYLVTMVMILTVAGITILGELNHPNIDYTPHYGIDQNIGVGTTGILFSIGPGGFDILGNPIGGRYYSPIYPYNAGGVEGPGSPGIGTFRLNDDQRSYCHEFLLPYFGRGTINVTGIASEHMAIKSMMM